MSRSRRRGECNNKRRRHYRDPASLPSVSSRRRDTRRLAVDEANYMLGLRRFKKEMRELFELFCHIGLTRNAFVEFRRLLRLEFATYYPELLSAPDDKDHRILVGEYEIIWSESPL